MQSRQHHQQEVRAFLQARFLSRDWHFALPEGTGQETYLAQSDERAYFVKLGAQPARNEAMASMGLTPQVLATGYLEDGTSIVVQPQIAGRTPSPKDYHSHLEQIATTIGRTHLSPELRRALPEVASDLYSVAGSQALARIETRWDQCRARVPRDAAFVDGSLARPAASGLSRSRSGCLAQRHLQRQLALLGRRALVPDRSCLLYTSPSPRDCS